MIAIIIIIFIILFIPILLLKRKILRKKPHSKLLVFMRAVQTVFVTFLIILPWWGFVMVQLSSVRIATCNSPRYSYDEVILERVITTTEDAFSRHKTSPLLRLSCTPKEYRTSVAIDTAIIIAIYISAYAITRKKDQEKIKAIKKTE